MRVGLNGFGRSSRMPFGRSGAEWIRAFRRTPAAAVTTRLHRTTDPRVGGTRRPETSNGDFHWILLGASWVIAVLARRKWMSEAQVQIESTTTSDSELDRLRCHCRSHRDSFSASRFRSAHKGECRLANSIDRVRNRLLPKRDRASQPKCGFSRCLPFELFGRIMQTLSNRFGPGSRRLSAPIGKHPKTSRIDTARQIFWLAIVSYSISKETHTG